MERGEVDEDGIWDAGPGHLSGLEHADVRDHAPIGMLIGGGVGLSVAALVCVTLSCFALIERHMRTIAEGFAAGTGIYRDFYASSKAARQEPRL